MAVSVTDPAGNGTITTPPRGTLSTTSTRPVTGSVGALPSYAGERADPLTGTYNLRAREYSPELGIFTSPDPIERSTTQPYTGTYNYAEGNPTTFVDPMGTTATLPGLLITNPELIAIGGAAVAGGLIGCQIQHDACYGPDTSAGDAATAEINQRHRDCFAGVGAIGASAWCSNLKSQANPGGAGCNYPGMGGSSTRSHDGSRVNCEILRNDGSDVGADDPEEIARRYREGSGRAPDPHPGWEAGGQPKPNQPVTGPQPPTSPDPTKGRWVARGRDALGNTIWIWEPR